MTLMIAIIIGSFAALFLVLRDEKREKLKTTIISKQRRCLEIINEFRK